MISVLTEFTNFPVEVASAFNIVQAHSHMLQRHD